jgi:hypothetical protein
MECKEGSTEHDDAKAVVTLGKANRLRGMKIRDEFLCPITYELMREPVVAQDGHTYEKSAIEKWLKTHTNSPRTGEPMESLTIANMNMKKLIQDLINEGGAGLYTADVSDSRRLFDVFAEKVLVLKCLGPPESDWNNESFQVSSTFTHYLLSWLLATVLPLLPFIECTRQQLL